MLVLGLAMISHGFRVRCIEHPPSNVAESNCYVYMILISFRSALATSPVPSTRCLPTVSSRLYIHTTYVVAVVRCLSDLDSL